MPTNFPSSLDDGDSLPELSRQHLDAQFDHDVLHVATSDAVVAVETKLGVGASPASGAAAGEALVADGGGGTAWGPVTAASSDGPVHLLVKNTSGGTLAKSTPVYATGSVGASGAVEVSASDASSAGTMPALGLLQTQLLNNGEGQATLLGVIGSLDTSTYSINDELYVAPGGGLTTTRPTAASDSVQKIGRVVRVNASTGEVLVLGAGRANDVPNSFSITGPITVQGNATVGGDLTVNAGGNTILNRANASTSTDIGGIEFQIDGTTYANLHQPSAGVLSTGANFGIGTTSPLEALHVEGDVYLPDDSSYWIGATSDSGGRVRLHHSVDGNGYFDYYDNLFFRSGASSSATRVTFTTGGQVGIGTSSPDSELVVAGASTLKIRVDDATYVQLGNRSSSFDILELTSYGSMEFAIDSNNNSSSKNFTWRDGGEHGAGTALMTLTDGGLLGIGVTSPSRRLHANTYLSGGRTYPLMVTNGTPGGGGVTNTEAAIWFATSSSSSTSRGAYISAINTGGGSNGHDLIFAVSANTQFPSEGMRLDKNKQLVHHRSGAFCGGPTSLASGYKNNWNTARSRGTFLTAGSTGITVNRNGFYYVRYVQRHNGTSSPYGGIGENGNRSTLESRTTGMWTHDHGAGASQFLESVYIGYLNSGELLTAGAVNSSSAANLVYSSSHWAGILYAFYLGE